MLKQRDYSISALRGVAMCLIISCHMMQYYNIGLAWWLNVGVQIFLVLSGYLYSSKTIEHPWKWIGCQFKKILIPYYFFLIISFIFYVWKVPSVSYESFGGSLLCISTVDGLGHLWFIRYILFCYLITPILYHLKLWLDKKSLKKSLGYLLAIWGTYILVSIPVYEDLNPIWISCYILGYYYGVFARKISAKELYHFKNIAILGAIGINVAKIAVNHSFSIPSSGITATLFSMFHDMSHLMLGFALYIIFLKIFKGMDNMKILSFSDHYSYEIYLVHQFFILSPFTLMDFTAYSSLNIITVLIVIAISGIILNRLSKRIAAQL